MYPGFKSKRDCRSTATTSQISFLMLSSSSSKTILFAAPPVPEILTFFGQNADNSGKSTREKTFQARLVGYFLRRLPCQNGVILFWKSHTSFKFVSWLFPATKKWQTNQSKRRSRLLILWSLSKKSRFELLIQRRAVLKFSLTFRTRTSINCLFYKFLILLGCRSIKENRVCEVSK